MKKAAYDRHYQKKGYFGKPMEGLMAFFRALEPKDTVYDFGCGQGRDALPLAKMGYCVVGVDISAVGIAQMNEAAAAQRLDAHGIVGDVYAMDVPDDADIVLLDAMLHFYKNDAAKETAWVARILSQMRVGGMFVSAMIADKRREATLKNIASGDAADWRVLHDGYGMYGDTAYHIYAIQKW